MCGLGRGIIIIYWIFAPVHKYRSWYGTDRRLGTLREGWGVEYCNIVGLSPPWTGHTPHSIPTIVHNETTFGPEKCVAIRCQGPESSTFQSIKCVICNLKCSTKTLQHTSESWHFQNFSLSWTNKVFVRLVFYPESFILTQLLIWILFACFRPLAIFLFNIFESLVWFYSKINFYTFKLELEKIIRP